MEGQKNQGDQAEEGHMGEAPEWLIGLSESFGFESEWTQEKPLSYTGVLEHDHIGGGISFL